MNNKKTIKINKFDSTNKFYNYLPKSKLFNSSGIKTATFPELENSDVEYELDIDALNIEKKNHP